MILRWLPVLLAVGCVHQAPVDPGSSLPFVFSGRPTYGEIRVVPALAIHDPIALNLDSYLGSALPYAREQVRRERTRQLLAVPASVGMALPGEVNGELGMSWAGQFRLAALPSGARDKVTDAVLGRRPGLDSALGEAARAVGGEATLFTWVSELEGEPLSLLGFPGEVVETPAGPVVLDHDDEPYLVTARIGMALVTQDGEVVVRYQDVFETILSGRSDEALAGRELARAVAHEVTLVWATDPRLMEYEPSSSSAMSLPAPGLATWGRASLR